jgi:drug/metabolite transporter (DMT)-like permease
MVRSRAHLHLPLAAVGLIVGAVLCFSLLDACVKFLAQRYPVPLLVWARYGLQAVATVIWLAPRMRLDLVRTPQLGLQLIRGTTLLVSSLCFFSALKFLPLADATAINYLTPIVVVVLSVVLLKERMTRSRWAFVAAGVVGMLLIVRPGASILRGAALLGLAAASFYATYQLLTRRLAAEDPRVTLFYPALCGTVLMTIVLPYLDHGEPMPLAHMALVALTGALGTAGHFLFILAFQRAPASALTPFTYLQLVWATLLGWLFFGAFPDAYTLLGILIIAGTGLALAWHERRKAALALPEEPTAVD